MDLPYKRIDKYEIIKEIGRGGMAVVYLAYDTVLEREVAIKVLPEYFRHDSEFIKRFKREAISASKLKHPNIVDVFDAGIFEGKYFIVIVPKNASIIYAGTDGSGVFKSTSGGENWSQAGAINAGVRSLAIDPSNTSIIYAGAWGGGVFKYVCTPP